MSTLVVNSLENTSGLEHFTAKAWVNFNGVTMVNNGNGNVSSLTDFGVGHYKVNLATALPDVNFSVSICPSDDDTLARTAYESGIGTARRTTTSTEFYVVNTSNQAVTDCGSISVIIYR